MNNPVILVVEDDTPIRNLMTTTLKTHDYKFLEAKDGSEAIMLTASHNPDIIFLDLGLPDMEGVEVIERIRSWSNIPIIVISARSEDTDKIEALDAGADDYLTKPFSVEELLARLRVVFYDEEELKLTPIEYKLLCLLAKNTGKVLTHTYITQNIWGRSWENDIASLRVYMVTLRKKLEAAPDAPRYIQTHIGIGYRMVKVD